MPEREALQLIKEGGCTGKYTLAVGIGCENVDEYYDPNSIF